MVERHRNTELINTGAKRNPCTILDTPETVFQFIETGTIAQDNLSSPRAFLEIWILEQKYEFSAAFKRRIISPYKRMNDSVA